MPFKKDDTLYQMTYCSNFTIIIKKVIKTWNWFYLNLSYLVNGVPFAIDVCVLSIYHNLKSSARPSDKKRLWMPLSLARDL